MERLKYISLVTELRQIAVARAMSLLDGKDDAEDVAGEVVLMGYGEKLKSRFYTHASHAYKFKMQKLGKVSLFHLTN